MDERFCMLCKTEIAGDVARMADHLEANHEMTEIARSVSMRKGTRVGRPY